MSRFPNEGGYQKRKGATREGALAQWNCCHKIKHSSKTQARSAKRRLIRTYPPERWFILDFRLNVYHCTECHGWHVGHSYHRAPPPDHFVIVENVKLDRWATEVEKAQGG